MSDWTAKAMESILREARKRLRNVCIACSNDLKQTVSVPAPRKVAKTSGRVYAATRATPGAPPRKLTGIGRTSIGYRVDETNLVGYVGASVFYMPYWEEHGHPWVEPTLNTNRARYQRILTGGKA